MFNAAIHFVLRVANAKWCIVLDSKMFVFATINAIETILVASYL